jgi:hypothetical protein
MTIPPAAGDAGTQYLAAHALHYTAKDLRAALDLYLALIKRHPDSKEAGYSRTQIDNIAKSIVAASHLLDTHIDLVSARLAQMEEAAPGGQESSE